MNDVHILGALQLSRTLCALPSQAAEDFRQKEAKVHLFGQDKLLQLLDILLVQEEEEKLKTQIEEVQDPPCLIYNAICQIYIMSNFRMKNSVPFLFINWCQAPKSYLKILHKNLPKFYK